jgi:hypothetical protein
MPKKAKAAESEAKPDEATKEQPRGSKTAAIKAALKANPKKSNIEISEILKAEGWDAKPTYISVVKSGMRKGKKKAKKAAPTAAPETAPALPKDAVSVALLVKAKKLVQELGGVKEANAALNALAQLMD